MLHRAPSLCQCQQSRTSVPIVSCKSHGLSPQCLTNAIGVSFRIFALILCTVSASPDTQTFVTSPFRGLRCNAGIGFGAEDVTVASSLAPLASLNVRHNRRRVSTLLAWTGSLCVGISSSVPSGCVHRWKAPGLACSTSSTSGPVRFDEKGTLKERLTLASAGVSGVIGVVPFDGRLMGGGGMEASMFGRDMPKAAGVIFSQPCRACPVKLLNFCISWGRLDLYAAVRSVVIWSVCCSCGRLAAVGCADILALDSQLGRGRVAVSRSKRIMHGKSPVVTSLASVWSYGVMR